MPATQTNNTAAKTGQRRKAMRCAGASSVFMFSVRPRRAKRRPRFQAGGKKPILACVPRILRCRFCKREAWLKSNSPRLKKPPFPGKRDIGTAGVHDQGTRNIGQWRGNFSQDFPAWVTVRLSRTARPSTLRCRQGRGASHHSNTWLRNR